MSKLPSPGKVIQEEDKAIARYKKLAKANRKLGRHDLAEKFEGLASKEEEDKKKLKAIYKL